MVINDDCVNYLDNIANDSIDLILIDPPYLVSRDSNFKKISENTSSQMATKYNISIDFGDWDKQELNWNNLFRQFSRILKKGGTLIIFYDVWKSTEIKDFAEMYKFKQPRVGVWSKTNPVPINSSVNYLSMQFTNFQFVMVKKDTHIPLRNLCT